MKLLRLLSSRYAPLVVCVLVFLLHAFSVLPIPFLDRLDSWMYDARLTALAPKAVNSPVVIVDIDERSLAAIGRWPWSRHTMAKLTQQLLDVQSVAAVGYDVVFAEPESAAADREFAKAIQGRPITLGYYGTSDRAGHQSGLLPQPALDWHGPDFELTHWTGYGANETILSEAAPHSGFFNATVDPDGVIRSAPLLAEFGGRYYESLPLALYRQYLAKGATLPSLTPELAKPLLAYESYPVVDSLRLTDHLGHSLGGIKVGRSVTQLIPFMGVGGPSGGTFQYISAKDVLQGTIQPKALTGKVVLVGSSAPALGDLRATPFGAVFPSVEVQASLVAGLIAGHAMVRPDFAESSEVLQLFCIAVLLLFVLPRRSAMAAAILTTLVAIALWQLHNYLLAYQHISVPSASALSLLALMFVLHSVQGFAREGRQRKKLTGLFGSYVPSQWVLRLAKSTEPNRMQASYQELTVMFCDMRGFTQLAEQLPALELQALLNDIFNRLSRVIESYGGTIDKYMGDCVMAFWGAPEPQADHARRAVDCALAMQEAMSAYNKEHAGQQHEVQMGIGINTGWMCVGDMGSEIRRSYTVIGEAVNTASRLQVLSKTYNQPIIVSRSTKDRVDQLPPIKSHQPIKPLFWQDLGVATLAGSDQSIPIFTVSSHEKNGTVVL